MRSVRSPARAVSGHATAELPTNEMKSRRLMCPQIEGPNLPYRRGTETALCNTAKLRGRGPGQNPKLPHCNMRACFSSNSGHASRKLSRCHTQITCVDLAPSDTPMTAMSYHSSGQRTLLRCSRPENSLFS
jgi:hypothetical protein